MTDDAAPSSKLFLAALVAGTLIRLAVLPLPGTRDMGVWKIWTFNAARDNPTHLYGLGGLPPEHRVLDFHGAETTVDYPPMALYELSLVGRAYRAVAGVEFPDNAALTAAIKALVVLAEAALVLLMFRALRATAGPSAARWATSAYWLSPAALLDASVLGYLDPLFVLPVVGALAAAVTGWPALAGGLFAIAVLTKAQAVVLVPAVVLALWNARAPNRRSARVGFAFAGAAVASTAILAPVAVAGAWPNMIAALESLTRHDMLSANACNLWWIVGYVLRVCYSFGDMGVWPAIVAPARILQISRTMELGYPNPRVVGLLLTLAAAGWGMWTARRARDLVLVSAAGAFLVHAYATLSAQVHENHLFAAIPLLAVAGARPRYRPLFIALSAILALNLNLFYGISEYLDGYAVPRSFTVVDMTVLLAIANCAALAWHATVLKIECSTAAGRLQERGPA